ncbi:hydantoinase/oxoprolinase family protein [Desulfosporosinus sp. PR]|uniref:hydantoinase/oxoprolinase family protein n=1 Tax=Candidatus Desulfosporosinus nitrosoreducens TaxID=3401928 RepID=UPI0027EECDA7|nr:hydantoinase/oxoprolinase family protein [Desulfosporosinus sp. PR]MDQ7092500.1 hydantoinase/oxoprolinase family protein [Desulfosporosinus sp. PR]
MYAIAVDVGGTFADLVLRDQQGHTFTAKVPSNYKDPLEMIIHGLSALAQELGFSVRELLSCTDKFIHGTTVGINALLQGQGAKTALITTAGFRDALELRRSQLSEPWDLRAVLPPVLVPRYLRLGLRERLDYRGVPLKALDKTQIPEIADFLRQEQVESVAVCLLFSWRNPAHEREFKELLQALLPQVFISLSSELSTQMGEYERTSTTVINARLSPVLSDYLLNLDSQLRDLGLRVPLSLARNNGGLTDMFQAKRCAVSTLFSGPAGGVKGGWALAHELDLPELVVADMGGTSFDVSLIRQGKMEVTPQAEVAGYPVQLPMLDIHTVGAGGGSIAWLDQGGMLRVGPHSAGAQPGPACYGLGGEEPTITDAALVLGLLDCSNFLGGRMNLDGKRALQAIETKIARPLGVSVPEAANAIYQVALSLMIDAVYLMTIKKGYDPRLFSLAAVGGALPLFATALAEGIGIRRVVIPAQAPVFCAQGLHYAPFQIEVSRGIYELLGEQPDFKCREAISELEEQADQELSRLGVASDRRCYLWSADLKYPDQHHEITLEFPCNVSDIRLWQRIGEAFHAVHQRRYGYSQPEKSLVLVNLRLLACEKENSFRTVAGQDTVGEAASSEICSVYRPGGLQEIRSYRWQDLKPGMGVEGPALIKRNFTTVFLEDNWRANLDQAGNLLLNLRKEGFNADGDGRSY